MSWRRRVARPRKARKPAKPRARKPAKTPAFRAHKHSAAGKAFRAHKAHNRSVFRAHGKRKLRPRSVSHAKRVKAIKARTRKARMRKAHLNLMLAARR